MLDYMIVAEYPESYKWSYFLLVLGALIVEYWYIAIPVLGCIVICLLGMSSLLITAVIKFFSFLFNWGKDE
jgi:hypothetical protein